MTTIREALRLQQGRGASAPSPPTPRNRFRRRALRCGVAAAMAALVAVLATLLWTPLSRLAQQSAPMPHMPAARGISDEPAPPVEAAAVAEVPRGRVEKWHPLAGGPLPAPGRAAAGGRSPGAADTAADHVAARSRDEAVPSRSVPVALGDGRRIALRAIAFSNVQEARTATIVIDGGEPRVVHEGETIGDIEVQLILRSSVYVRQGGTVVALTL